MIHFKKLNFSPQHLIMKLTVLLYLILIPQISFAEDINEVSNYKQNIQQFVDAIDSDYEEKFESFTLMENNSNSKNIGMVRGGKDMLWWNKAIWTTTSGHMLAGHLQYELPAPRYYFTEQVKILENMLASFSVETPLNTWDQVCFDRTFAGFAERKSQLDTQMSSVKSTLGLALENRFTHWEYKISYEAERKEFFSYFNQATAVSVRDPELYAQLMAKADEHKALMVGWEEKMEQMDAGLVEVLNEAALALTQPAFTWQAPEEDQLAARRRIKQEAIGNLRAYLEQMKKARDDNERIWLEEVNNVASAYEISYTNFSGALGKRNEELAQSLEFASKGLQVLEGLTIDVAGILIDAAETGIKAGIPEVQGVDEALKAGFGQGRSLFRGFSMEPQTSSRLPGVVTKMLKNYVSEQYRSLKSLDVSATIASLNLPNNASCYWDNFEPAKQKAALNTLLEEVLLAFTPPKLLLVDDMAKIFETSMWAHWLASHYKAFGDNLGIQIQETVIPNVPRSDTLDNWFFRTFTRILTPESLEPWVEFASGLGNPVKQFVPTQYLAAAHGGSTMSRLYELGITREAGINEYDSWAGGFARTVDKIPFLGQPDSLHERLDLWAKAYRPRSILVTTSD